MIDPNELPLELREQLYVPELDCWKHHVSVLSTKEMKRLTPLLKDAGIVMKKSSAFTEEEDKIIMRNWDGIKDELGYKEGEDARMFAGHGLRSNGEVEVSEFVERAKRCSFSPRIGEGLLDRPMIAIRARFVSLFDPKKLNLNGTPFEMTKTKRNHQVVKQDGKRCGLSERELKLVSRVLSKNDYEKKKTSLELQRYMGAQWNTTTIEQTIDKLNGLEDRPMDKDEWKPFYKAVIKHYLVAKQKTEMELIERFENENYNWENRVPWLLVALSRGVHLRKQHLIIAWRLILEKIRNTINQFRVNGRPFVIFHLIQYVQNFDVWRTKQEADGNIMTERKAVKRYEKKGIALERQVVTTQQHRNRGREDERHPIVRFDNGELLEIEKGTQITKLFYWKQKSNQKKRKSVVELLPIELDVIDEDGDNYAVESREMNEEKKEKKRKRKSNIGSEKVKQAIDSKETKLKERKKQRKSESMVEIGDGEGVSLKRKKTSKEGETEKKNGGETAIESRKVDSKKKKQMKMEKRRIQKEKSSKEVNLGRIKLWNIAETVKRCQLMDLLKPIDSFLNLSYPRKKEGAGRRGYAFVKFKSNEKAAAALIMLKGSRLNGKRMGVRMANVSRPKKSGPLPIPL